MLGHRTGVGVLLLWWEQQDHQQLPLVLHRNASKADVSASGPYYSQGQRCPTRRSAEGRAVTGLRQPAVLAEVFVDTHYETQQ